MVRRRSGRRWAAHRTSTQAVRIQPSVRTRTVVARGVAPRTGEVLHPNPTLRKQLKAAGFPLRLLVNVEKTSTGDKLRFIAISISR
jgi:hypothetical protein